METKAKINDKFHKIGFRSTSHEMSFIRIMTFTLYFI